MGGEPLAGKWSISTTVVAGLLMASTRHRAQDAAMSLGVSILAGGQAGQRIEELLSDLLPEQGRAPFDEILLVLPESDARTFLAWRERASKLSVDLRLAELTWPDHFGQARQFAFEHLSTSWRGYLDADDRFPQAEKVREFLQQLARQAPEVSALALPHIHVHAEHTVQPVRFVRWADGWRWQGAVHENLVSTTAEQLDVAFFPDAPVLHQTTPAEAEESLARNERIIEKALAMAMAAGDSREWNRLRYHRALNAAARGNTREALLEFEQVYKNTVGETQTVTIAHLAAIRACELAHVDGVGAVLEWAGRAIAAMPTQQAGWAKLLIACVTQQRWPDAVAAWSGWQNSAPVPQIQWSEFESAALVPAAAALALAACGEAEEAKKILNRIPVEYQNVEPAKALTEAARHAMTEPTSDSSSS